MIEKKAWLERKSVRSYNWLQRSSLDDIIIWYNFQRVTFFDYLFVKLVESNRTNKKATFFFKQKVVLLVAFIRQILSVRVNTYYKIVVLGSLLSKIKFIWINF